MRNTALLTGKSLRNVLTSTSENGLIEENFFIKINVQDVLNAKFAYTEGPRYV